MSPEEALYAGCTIKRGDVVDYRDEQGIPFNALVVAIRNAERERPNLPDLDLLLIRPPRNAERPEPVCATCVSPLARLDLPAVRCWLPLTVVRKL